MAGGFWLAVKYTLSVSGFLFFLCFFLSDQELLYYIFVFLKTASLYTAMKHWAFAYEGDLETHPFVGVFGIYTEAWVWADPFTPPPRAHEDLGVGREASGWGCLRTQLVLAGAI